MKHFPQWLHLCATLCFGGLSTELDIIGLWTDADAAYEVALGSLWPSTTGTSRTISADFPPDVSPALLHLVSCICRSTASWRASGSDSSWMSSVCVLESATLALPSLTKAETTKDDKSRCSEGEGAVWKETQKGKNDLQCVSFLI